jgi:hypothetical protein
VVCKILNRHELNAGCASVENARVSGVGKALNRQDLVIRREGGEFSIVFIVVAVEDRDYEIPFATAGFGERFASGKAALEHEGAILADEACVSWGEDAIGDGDGEFGEQAVDVCVVDRVAGDGFQFADEIGGSKATARGVGMGVAQAIGVRVGGERASASIGEGKSATGEVGRGVREEPFGRLRVDILRRMSKAAARGVGMVVAEAVGLWSGGTGTAASIRKGESASGEVGGGGVDGTVRKGVGGNPIGRLRADILHRMSKALASHGESLAK